MKTKTLFAGFFILLSLVSVNCAHSSKRMRQPVTAISIAHDRKLKVGDPVDLSFKVKIKDTPLKLVELYIDNQRVYKTDKTNFTYTLTTSQLQVGIHAVKTVTTDEQGSVGENYSEFLLLSDKVPTLFGYKVNRTIPHDISHFTEGLEIKQGVLYEGTGQEGSSALYKIDLISGKTLKSFPIESQYFGEGITICKNKLYQLTYRTQIGFIRNPDTFELLKTWNYKYEQGWGLTNNGEELIMSDGTANLYFLNPETLQEVRKIQVCDHQNLIVNLNELEYINGEIWANIWMSDKMVRIDPKSGKVLAEINLQGLINSTAVLNQNNPDVLNGIAYDQEKHKLYVTGKYWPKLFEIELQPVAPKN